MQKTKSLSIVSLLIMLCTIFIFAGCTGGIQTFDVTGQVVYKGTPIANAKITSDLVGESIYTDENGIFAFLQLAGTTTITVEAEGYYFAIKSQVATQNKSQIIFNAEKLYTLRGQVVSNGVGISGARVVVVGSINATATTDPWGFFEIENVAGDVRVAVEKEGFLFEEKTASVTNCNLTISGSTDIEATVTGAEDATDLALKIGDTDLTYQTDKYVASSVLLGSVVTPTATGYHFEPSSITITRENQVLNFTAYKIYNVTGVVKSGETPISNVTIKVGSQTTTSNEQGEFELSGLWGESYATFTHSVYQFENVDLNPTTTSITAQGTFTFENSVLCDGVEVEGLEMSVNSVRYVTDENGEFKLSNVKLGDIIEFVTDEYKISNYTISNIFGTPILAQKYYTAEIHTLCDSVALADVTFEINDTTVTTNERGIARIEKLTGECTATISKTGYKSETLTFTQSNSTQDISLKEYYNLSVIVTSGEIALNNANVYIDDELQTLTDNTLTINNLVDEATLYVECDGYNPSQDITINKTNNTISINLSYSVFGSVLNGNAVPAGAEVVATNLNSQQTKTTLDANGEFELTLYGQNVILPSAEGLTFTQQTTTQQSTINFSATYSISGKLLKDENGVETPMVNAEVVLTGSEVKTTNTNENGEFAFENLSGEWYLSTNTTGVTLYPERHEVNKSGVYSFSAKGYTLGGRVTCGEGVGLAGVTVRSSGGFVSTATTNSDGYYTFKMLMGEVTITAEKAGYSITANYTSTNNDGILTSDDKERTDVNFTATYSVSGVIKSGSSLLAGVTVKVGASEVVTNETGEFTFSGLVGTNTLEVTKEGFTFNNPANISGVANLNIVGTFSLSGVVTTGLLPVVGANVAYNKTTITTDENGEFTLSNLEIGGTISVSKLGYEFANDTYSITGYTADNIIFDGTYSVTGIVKSIKSLSGVVVSFGNSQVTTNNLGEFEITGLNSAIELTFTLNGYDFDKVNVSSYQDLSIVAKSFSVDGYVTVGGKPLANVSVTGGKVTAGGVTTTTNSQGYYKLEGLTVTQKSLISLALDGYEFSGDVYAFDGATSLNFTATYMIKVQVDCGSLDTFDKTKYNLDVTAGNASISKDGNYWIIKDLTGEVEISATANGYNSNSVVVSEFTSEIVTINLSYDLIVNINGSAVENYSVVYASDNKNETLTLSGTTFTLSNLMGTTTFAISKEKIKFFDASTQGAVPAKFTKSTTITLGYAVIYTITGKVTAKEGNSTYNIQGARVYTSGTSTVTDASGNYTLTDLIGSNTIYAELPGVTDNVEQVSLKFNSTGSSVQSNIVSANSTCNFVVEDTNKFKLWLIQNGYQKMRDSAGYTNITTGTVTPSMGGAQNVYGLRKKSNGKYLIENKNEGGVVNAVVLTVDPNVSLVAYYEPNKNVEYKHVSGDSNVNRDGNGTILTKYASAGWQSKSLSTFAGTSGEGYGINPTGLGNYIIRGGTNTTVKSYEAITISNNCYVVQIALDNESATTNYRVQMKRLSGQDVSFTGISITYYIGLDGVMQKAVINESYDAAGGLATCNSNFTETFTLTNGKEDITKTKYESNEF